MNGDASQLSSIFNVRVPEIVYHAITHGINDPFNIIDRNYRILWANAGKARLCGTSQDKLIGRLCYEAYQKRQEVCPQCPVAAAFSSGKACVVTRDVTMQSGSKSSCEIRTYPVHNARGEIVCGITIGFDITSRNRSLHTHRTRAGSDKTADPTKTLFTLPSSLFFEGGAMCDSLSDREIEVLHFVASGLTNNNIAAALAISPHTVKTHIMHIFNKLGVSDRTQAAIRGIHLGLI
jgi:PAS domain S-box-containing protein